MSYFWAAHIVTLLPIHLHSLGLNMQKKSQRPPPPPQSMRSDPASCHVCHVLPPAMFAGWQTAVFALRADLGVILSLLPKGKASFEIRLENNKSLQGYIQCSQTTPAKHEHILW